LAAVIKQIESNNVQPVDVIPKGYATDNRTPNKITLFGVNWTFTHDGKKATLDLSPEFLNGPLV
jgi:hypothetical protein